jgi:hypothetical protein
VEPIHHSIAASDRVLGANQQPNHWVPDAAGIRVDCENEYLTGGGKLLTGGGKLLTTGHQQYWLVVGGDRIPLPVLAQPIMGKLGFLRAECG